MTECESQRRNQFAIRVLVIHFPKAKAKGFWDQRYITGPNSGPNSGPCSGPKSHRVPQKNYWSLVLDFSVSSLVANGTHEVHRCEACALWHWRCQEFWSTCLTSLPETHVFADKWTQYQSYLLIDETLCRESLRSTRRNGILWPEIYSNFALIANYLCNKRAKLWFHVKNWFGCKRTQCLHFKNTFSPLMSDFGPIIRWLFVSTLQALSLLLFRLIWSDILCLPLIPISLLVVIWGPTHWADSHCRCLSVALCLSLISGPVLSCRNRNWIFRL